MIVFAVALIGAIWGGLQARRRGGNRLDMLQYAAGYAILFGLLGLVATIIIARTM
ncbi:apolipoprotein acyltransferase [Profundibacterium mesophilum]|uniref:Apolipoprotein acyltransferase n=1 Tax=Profundibacterium mesophilum KAUST100406-0324 TaxID=1037889 RepID=A0A921TET9_9RHOB|nr:apolipoprotein acyltransferase [Profundibacterium mesophilum]KAF0677641.1 hypothetical protein PMES_00148 [Profundibacterium mesophilum KAUST100406-0324]